MENCDTINEDKLTNILILLNNFVNWILVHLNAILKRVIIILIKNIVLKNIKHPNTPKTFFIKKKSDTKQL